MHLQSCFATLNPSSSKKVRSGMQKREVLGYRNASHLKKNQFTFYLTDGNQTRRNQVVNNKAGTQLPRNKEKTAVCREKYFFCGIRCKIMYTIVCFFLLFVFFYENETNRRNGIGHVGRKLE